VRRAIGLDLGRARDHSALAVLEVEDREDAVYRIIHLDQQPLGVDYRAIVRWVEETCRRFPHSALVVDVGEAGGSVMELLRERGLEASGVRITGGEHESRDVHGVFHVAKTVLAGLLDVVTASRRLKADPPTQKWAKDLERQLRGFTRKLTADGAARFEARTEAVHDDLVLAAALGLWWLEHHAGVPVFMDFHPALHVSRAPLLAMPGLRIMRGWRLWAPVSCVWFQVWDGGREVQVLFEVPPVADLDVTALRQIVLSDSGTLFPGFRCEDYVAPQAFEPMAGAGGSRSLADQLRPDILPRRGEGALPRQLAVMRKWLTSLVGGRPALRIDLRCDAQIRALGGGYVFRQQQGRVLPIPRDDAHAAVMEALMVALAAPAVTMTPSERAKILGPKVLMPE
jgi:hypothetical protein